jgi:hypothetical protein
MLTTFSAVLADLSIGQILSDIPRDAGAIIVYAVIGIFVGLIWLGSRGKGKGGSATES